MMNAMQPSTSVAIPLSWRTKIARRWQELEPKVKWKERDPLQREAMQVNHYSLLATLLSQGIEMRVVRRQALDDVTLSAVELTRRRDESLAASRMLKEKRPRKPRR